MRRLRLVDLLPFASIVVWTFAYVAWSRDTFALRFPAVNVPLLLVTIGLVPFCAWALVRIPRWQADNLSSAVAETDRFNAENEGRKTLATILAGVALLAGSYSAMVTFLEQREERFAARYVSAVQNLGTTTDDARPLRVGAIYALERIGRSSSEDYDPIVELLTSFVRERGARTPEDRNPPEDVRAAVAVLARRQIEREYPFVHILQLANTNLKGLDLRGAHLEFADLRGADLSGSDLSAAHVCGADLSGTEFRDARLRDADLRLAALSAMPGGTDVKTILLDGAVLYGPAWSNARPRDVSDLKLAGTAVNVGSTFNSVVARSGSTPVTSVVAVNAWLASVRERFPKSRMKSPCYAEEAASVKVVHEFGRAYGSQP
jgi:hypothetical protein